MGASQSTPGPSQCQTAVSRVLLVPATQSLAIPTADLRAEEAGGMNPRFGRRQWVKLWVNEWLEGTTRYEMSDAQRAFWIDLLSMAGRSRFPGVICAGEVEGKLIGYPLSKYQALPSGPLDIEATFNLFVQRGKIALEVSHDSPAALYLIRIVNWGRFQSEYQRTKNYQKTYRTKKTNIPSYHQTNSTSNSLPIGTEVEVEEIQNPCANLTATHDGNSTVSKHSEDELNTIRRVWNYYLQKLGKNPKILSLTTLRRNKGVARLSECLQKTGGDMAKAEGLLCVAVDSLAASAFHVGENDQKKRYDSWEKHLFKSQEQLEQWLERS
jgi:hypothetical protein